MAKPEARPTTVASWTGDVVAAGKARVHELAKELGVTSKEVLARLSEQGEFVKSASSTVEA
ncbi:hypothetical protein DSL40_11135, partial [Mycobacterium tuberculosis]